MYGIVFRSFRKRNGSHKNTNTVYSVYSHSGIVPKERALSCLVLRFEIVLSGGVLINYHFKFVIQNRKDTFMSSPSTDSQLS